MNLTYNNYVLQPNQAVELRFKMIFVKNPNLIKSLIRDINHPLLKKKSYIPIKQ